MGKGYLSKRIRQLVKARANGACEYCKFLDKFRTEFDVVDHIIPRAKGGTDELDNLAHCCSYCNGCKGESTEAYDSEGSVIAALFNPRQQAWSHHFRWDDTLTEIIGLTPTGRATVTLLDMNRLPIKRFRKIAIGQGHPPN